MDIAVLFADVRGSTGLGERLDPTAFAALMNRFYQTANDVLISQDAVIDKMVGDEVMALFIPGFCGPQYPRIAVQAGEALIRAVESWLPLGVSVHAGPAFVGNVGGAGITDFTALGDTVNTAARLQGQAASGELVLSEIVYRAVAERYPGLDQRLLTLRGKEEPFMVRILRPASQGTTLA